MRLDEEEKAGLRVGLIVLAVVVVMAFLNSCPARGASGYDPRDRGLTQSCVRFNNVNASLTCQPLDFEVEDFSSYPYLSEPYVRLYEKRYGECILASCPGRVPPKVFKRWPGPGNEVKGTLVETLKWACRTGRLNAAKATPDCLPTEREVTDMQATGDRLWAEYLKSEVVGFRSDNREVIRDPERGPGLGQEPHSFWGITWYWDNQIGQTPGPTPVDPPPVVVPPQPPAPTYAIQCPASSLLGLAKAVKQRCGSGAGRGCDWRVVKLAEEVVKGIGMGCP